MGDHRGRPVGAREELSDGEERHQEGRARCDGKDDGGRDPRRQAGKRLTQIVVCVVDHRIHRHDVVEAAQIGGQHVARGEFDLAVQRLGDAPLGDLHKLRRDVDGGHPRAAAGQFLGHCAGAAARVQNAGAGQVLGQARQHDRAHPVAALAHRLADAGHGRVGRQPLPCLGCGAVEIGLDPVTRGAVCGRRHHQSNPRSSKMSRSSSGCGVSASVPFHIRSARRMYSARHCTMSSSSGISKSVFFFRRDRRMASTSGM